MTTMYGLQSSLQPSFTQQVTPFRSSYDGLSGNDMMTLAGAQQSYHPQAPAQNAQAAEAYIRSAAQATDPALANALLEKALAAITPGGASSMPLAPTGGGSPGGGYAPSGSASYAPAGGPATSLGSNGPGLTVSGDTIDTGRYSIAAGKSDDGSLTVTDKQTGKSFEVWGDPHIRVDGKDTADFQKDNLKIQLQDGTVIDLQPGTLKDGVSHLDQVSVTKNGQAVTIGGQDGSFANGVMTSDVMDDAGNLQSGLYDAPGTDAITYGADDMLHYNNANGSMGGVISAGSDGGETSLDGVGGGLAGQPAASSTAGGAGSGADQQQLISQLMSAITQYVGGFEGSLMQNELSTMMNQSGFEQA